MNLEGGGSAAPVIGSALKTQSAPARWDLAPLLAHS